MKTKKTSFRVHIPSGWYIGFAVLIVIGSVMAFGLALLGYGWFSQAQEEPFILMLGMILPMSLVMYAGIYAILRHINKKISPLLDAMHQVSEGNLDIRLNESYAGEYAPLYRDFNKMTKELKQTKDAMNAFVNEFAHEFKTPITSISGFADYLVEAGDAIDREERDAYLNIISEQSHRLVNLSQNTLLLSKVEATQIIVDKEEYSLSEQLRSCAILFLKELERRNITLNMSEDSDYRYVGNMELMEQIWINLFGNAVKFTPDGGKIFVFEEEENGELIIRISDTGSGMSEETITHIFEKYYQNDTTNLVKGNGIGLSIVKRIVELCNGRVEVQSELGKGSTFVVVLPIE